MIDPGHGGVDPGTSSVSGVTEKEIVLKFAERLKQKLAAGQISRRGFMEGALAIGATVAGADAHVDVRVGKYRLVRRDDDVRQ